MCTLVPCGYGFAVWTKQPKRLNSLVCATTIWEDPVSVTTDVALKGKRGPRRRSDWRSAICVVCAGSGIVYRSAPSRANAPAIVTAKARIQITRAIFCFPDEAERRGYHAAVSASGQSRCVTQCSSRVQILPRLHGFCGAISRAARTTTLPSIQSQRPIRAGTLIKSKWTYWVLQEVNRSRRSKASYGMPRITSVARNAVCDKARDGQEAI